ncbi:MAG: sugar kinase, partial [Proteobacteria bacterium]|nr:sugar kinase [Pseudomonadota bacterium]
MSSIVAVGSLAFDSIETPFGSVGKVLGGSANHFSLSASYFTPVRCISVVGADYPQTHLNELKSRGIDITGVKLSAGKTFHWSGKYGYDLHEATTLETRLNVFETFVPEVPDTYKDSEFLFLGNILPSLQEQVVSHLPKAKFVAVDTMNFWMDIAWDTLLETIARVDLLTINDEEARQLSGERSLLKAARKIATMGPRYLIIKKGEHGALLFGD